MTTEPRWLNAEEQKLWRDILGTIRKINRGMEEALMARGDLSVSEFSVLVSLSEAPEQQLRLRELCADLDWDRSRTSHQVTRMERRGLVEKMKSVGDARGVVVRITDAGLECLEAAAPDHVESVRQLVFDPMDMADVEVLKKYFAAVVDHPVDFSSGVHVPAQSEA